MDPTGEEVFEDGGLTGAIGETGEIDGYRGGDPGDVGTPGAPREAGEAGAPGDPGEAGAPGEPGDTGTPGAVGTDTGATGTNVGVSTGLTVVQGHPSDTVTNPGFSTVVVYPPNVNVVGAGQLVTTVSTVSVMYVVV